MSLFNTLIQNLAPDWVRARVLAIYLLVFQGSVAAGSAIWGYAADHTSAHLALSFSSFGIVACILLRFPLPLPVAKVDLSSWNHWGKPTLYAEPTLDQGPILVTVEYTIDPKNAPEFLEMIYHYQRIRRRDGAVRWGIFYDSEIPNRYLESFLVDSWGEHLRQHDRFTLGDRQFEDKVNRFSLEPAIVKHYIHAARKENK